MWSRISASSLVYSASAARSSRCAWSRAAAAESGSPDAAQPALATMRPFAYSVS